MFSPASFNPVSFNPISWAGIEIVPPSEVGQIRVPLLIRRRRR